jgi:transcriptional regulator of acetoin/glycerol metabolism
VQRPILAAVAANPGHLERAALALGISRTTLWRRLKFYDMVARRESVQGGELDA